MLLSNEQAVRSFVRLRKKSLEKFASSFLFHTQFVCLLISNGNQHISVFNHSKPTFSTLLKLIHSIYRAIFISFQKNVLRELKMMALNDRKKIRFAQNRSLVVECRFCGTFLLEFLLKNVDLKRTPLLYALYLIRIRDLTMCWSNKAQASESMICFRSGRADRKLKHGAT